MICEKRPKWPESAAAAFAQCEVALFFIIITLRFMFTFNRYRLSDEILLSFGHQISKGNVSWNTGGASVMFVASYEYWLHRFITEQMTSSLILMQCDKMQSAVKRAGGGKRGQGR